MKVSKKETDALKSKMFSQLRDACKDSTNVVQEDFDTLWVHNVKGTKLSLCFKRCMFDWKPVIKVLGKFADHDNAFLAEFDDNFVIASELDVNDEVKEFWAYLSSSSTNKSSLQRLTLVQEAMKILGE
jgi:hypothetical protein